MKVEILLGDCRQILRSIPDDSVDCAVCSPPYFGLRDYDVDGQIGLEPTVSAFVDELVDVFREVRRVLRPDGTLWLNLGDSYAGSWGAQAKRETPGEISRNSVRNHPKRARQAGTIRDAGLKPKDLIGIPWRVAFALQDDGWWLRQEIIWSKMNPMPESVRDRCTKAHESLFLLAKSESYYFDQAAIAEPAECERGPGNTRPYEVAGQRPGENANKGGSIHKIGKRETRNKRSVWAIPSEGFNLEMCTGCKRVYGPAEYRSLKSESRLNAQGDVLGRNTFCSCGSHDQWLSHFATYPPALIVDCIKAGCRPGGTVLDPFFGAGTTGLVANREQRNCIGIELNPDYTILAEHRIRADGGILTNISTRAA